MASTMTANSILTCKICSQVPSYGKLSQGRCDKCRVYFQRTGRERPTALPILFKKSGTCLLCASQQDNLIKGYCPRCRYYHQRYGINDPTEIMSRRGWNLKIPALHKILQLQDNPQWRGDNAKPETKRRRAVRRYPLQGISCENCGGPAKDRHHRTGNLNDHSRNEIRFLCRRCHMIEDGRLERLRIIQAINAQKIKPPSPCVICGMSAKGLRKGRCHKCNEYFRRNGKEWSPEFSRQRRII